MTLPPMTSGRNRDHDTASSGEKIYDLMIRDVESYRTTERCGYYAMHPLM